MRPLNNNVFVDRDQHPTHTPEGIEIVNPELENSGTVVAVGPGTFSTNGTRIPVCVGVGDRVVFPSWCNQTIVDDRGDEHLVMADTDLVALVEAPNETNDS